MKKPRRITIKGASLQSTLDRLCRKHRLCGASLAVLKDGAIHVAASGFANAPERIEATPSTLFQVGSISKTFTATLAMQLVDEGRLDLDAPVRRYLPEFKTGDSRSSEVTVRQLLTHSSGIEGDFFPPDDTTSESYVRRMHDLPQLHAPGEYMNYCNSGYVVLTRIIEMLRAVNWGDLVLDRIARPLGLTQILAHPKDSLRFRMATGHVQGKAGSWSHAPTGYFPLSMAGAGTILSMSAHDLVRYAEAHMDGPTRRTSKSSLLSKASFRAMQTPQILMPPHSRAVHTHMGLSWFTGPQSTHPILNHDGGTSQLAFLHVLPKQRVAYALLINNISATMGEAVRKAIFTEVAGLPAEPTPKVPKAIAFNSRRYTGVYKSLYQTQVVDTAKAGHLRVTIQDNPPAKATHLTLRAIAPDVFAILEKPQADLGHRVVFLGDEDGRARYCRFGVRMNRRLEPSSRRKSSAQPLQRQRPS